MTDEDRQKELSQARLSAYKFGWLWGGVSSLIAIQGFLILSWSGLLVGLVILVAIYLFQLAIMEGSIKLGDMFKENK